MKTKILELLASRWPDGTVPSHSLAEEARQIREELSARSPGPVQYGQAKIPKQASMENILREPYSALSKARHGIK
jgi:hypothetical protein